MFATSGRVIIFRDRQGVYVLTMPMWDNQNSINPLPSINKLSSSRFRHCQDGIAALIAAARHGKARILRMLIRMGASLDITDNVRISYVVQFT